MKGRHKNRNRLEFRQRQAEHLEPRLMLTVPATVSITPNSGSAPIGEPTTFTGRFQDADGFGDIRIAEFRISNEFSSTPRCLVRYDQLLNRLSLYDGSSDWLHAGAPGSSNSVSMVDCTLHAADATVTPVGSTMLDVGISVSLKDRIAGNRNLWMRVLDDSGDWSTQDDRGDINIGGGLASGGTASYQLTYASSWSPSTHPTNFPSNPHYSGLIGATHDDGYSLWEPGGIASQGIEDMAELGSRTLLFNQISAMAGNGDVGGVLSGPGLSDSPASATYNFDISSSYPLVSLTSMVAPSPDWFVGVHDLSLKDSNGFWYDSLTVSLDPYDAGTDNGATYVATNSDTQPQTPIANLRGLFPFSDAPLASFTFTRTDVPVDPAPGAPTGLSATAADEQIDLDWADNSETDLNGYNVYRSTTSGGSFAKINASLLSTSSFMDNGLTNGTTYFYVVTAVDHAGNESAFSSQTSGMPEGGGGTGDPMLPTTVSITPNDLTVEVGTEIIFTARYSDENGADDIRYAEFRTNNTFYANPRCIVRYDNLLNTYSLYEGSSWLNAGAPGAGTTVSTAACSLNAAGSSVQQVDTNTLDVAFAVTYDSALEGARNLWLSAFDQQWGSQDDRGDVRIEARDEPNLPGDADGDGEVGFADFLQLAENFGKQEAVWADGDFNDDGKVDFTDFLILAEHYGQTR